MWSCQPFSPIISSATQTSPSIVSSEQATAFPFSTFASPFPTSTFSPLCSEITGAIPQSTFAPTPILPSEITFAPTALAATPTAPILGVATESTQGIHFPPVGSTTFSQFPRPPNWIPTTFDTFPPSVDSASSPPTSTAKHAPKHQGGPVKITYFGLKARAFLPLLVAEAGGIPYEWNKVAMEDWPALKAHTPFGQLPVMEHGDITIGQSVAIASYIARLAGLLGQEDADFATSQMLLAQYEDMLAALAKAFYSSNKAEDMEKFFAEKVPSDLQKLEKLVSGGFTNERTLGELAIFAILNIFLDMQPDTLDAFPALTAFYKHLASDPKISAFLATKAGGLWYKKDW